MAKRLMTPEEAKAFVRKMAKKARAQRMANRLKRRLPTREEIKERLS